MAHCKSLLKRETLLEVKTLLIAGCQLSYFILFLSHPFLSFSSKIPIFPYFFQTFSKKKRIFCRISFTNLMCYESENSSNGCAVFCIDCPCGQDSYYLFQFLFSEYWIFQSMQPLLLQNTHSVLEGFWNACESYLHYSNYNVHWKFFTLFWGKDPHDKYWL